MFEGIFQITIIVDANIVLRDILWLVRKRKNPLARPEFRELLDAKTILAIAPTFLEEEIQTNLPKIAVEHKISIDEMHAHWAEYRALIKFFDVGGADSAFEDPKDAPYIKLQRKHGHLIYSQDTDIARMGGDVASTALIANLRIYSRHVVIEYSLKIGGTGALHISFVMLEAIFIFAREIMAKTVRLPKWMLWIAVIIIVCALMYSPTRKILINFVQTLPEKSKVLGARAFDLFSSLAMEHQQAKSEAQEAMNKISIQLNSNA